MEQQIETEVAPTGRANGKVCFVRVYPPELWRLLKVRAAVEGRTLQNTLARAIQQYLATPPQ